MKKIILALSIIFLGCLTSYANLACEEEYWIEEINKTGTLSDRMLSDKFEPSIESFVENIYGGSKSEMALWYNIIETVANVIRNNSANLKNVQLTRYNDPGLREYYFSSLLNALIYSKTIETLEVQSLDAKYAHIVAEIIKKNNSIKEMIFKYPQFTNQGAMEIAEALEKNDTLQVLRLRNSEFSMNSRRRIRDSWNKNAVEGKIKEIEF